MVFFVLAADSHVIDIEEFITNFFRFYFGCDCCLRTLNSLGDVGENVTKLVEISTGFEGVARWSMKSICPSCEGTQLTEDEATGQLICLECGTATGIYEGITQVLMDCQIGGASIPTLGGIPQRGE
ncbi:hypothetical protein AHF37_01081 [Paragonimus kellicotti]|nr:hypothetical protein AHF37_01081 [Paragonimus kellicotti]